LRTRLRSASRSTSVPAARRYYLVYPPRLAGSPKLDLFRAWLLDEIRGGAPAQVAPTRKRRRR
jgi:DNA-binding transcriptional LysR family regulator